MPVIDDNIAPDGPVISLYVGVSVPKMMALRAAGQPIAPPVLVRALIDTGASCTVVDKSVVQSLGLTPTGAVQMHTPSTAGVAHLANQFDASVWFIQPAAQLPAQQAHPMAITLPVIEADFSILTIQALIGRDILARCVLIYSGPTGRIQLTF